VLAPVSQQSALLIGQEDFLMTYGKRLLAAGAVVAAGLGLSGAAQSQVHFGLGVGGPYMGIGTPYTYGMPYHYGPPYYSPYSTWGGMYGTWPGYYYGFNNPGYRYWD
jgi:hypothetical protein